MTINESDKSNMSHLVDNIVTEPDDEHIMKIVELLSLGFDKSCSREHYTATTGDEICVTHLMIDCMIDINREIYNNIFSEIGSFSYQKMNGNRKDQRPDISIELPAAFNLDNPLIIEAKLINDDYGTFREYCLNGIKRFTDTNYSYWNSNAFMIAYVRNGKTLDELNQYLEKNDSNRIVNDCKFIKPGKYLNKSEVSSSDNNLRYSDHERVNLDPIRIWHKWVYSNNYTTK